SPTRRGASPLAREARGGDPGKPGDGVVLGGVAGDAHGADDAVAVADEDAAAHRDDLAVEGAVEGREEVRPFLGALAEGGAGQAHHDRAVGLAASDLEAAGAGTVLPLKREGVAPGVDDDDRKGLEAQL